MPSILGANSVSGDLITNSLCFNKGDSAKLSFTQGTPTSRRTWTYSTWVKRGNLADQQESILSWGDEDFFDIRFQDGTPDDGLIVYISDGDSKNVATNRLFRDPSAWYHIVVASDTTDGTAGDRTRIYVNGVEETSFAAEAQPDQNYDYRGLVSGDPIVIGNRYTGSHFFDGYLADTHFIDGQQLAPSNFGETNDNGVWIPKKYLGTYGTNGFKLEYKQTGTSANSSGMGADTSGNDNHFAANNLATTDVTTDTPTNNFMTLNSLTNTEQTFSEGQTKTVKGGNAGSYATSTFEVNKGKWYFESKLLNYSGDSRPTIGLAQSHNSFTAPLASSSSPVVYYLLETNYYRSDTGTAVTVNSSPATNDIYMWGIDLDNLKFYIGKNGTWLHSSDPSANSNGLAIETSAYYAVATSPNDNGTDNTRNNEWFFNFGNPAYANSSSVSDASGYGDFEYTVPTGFYSYCTKNLASFG